MLRSPGLGLGGYFPPPMHGHARVGSGKKTKKQSKTKTQKNKNKESGDFQVFSLLWGKADKFLFFFPFPSGAKWICYCTH